MPKISTRVVLVTGAAVVAVVAMAASADTLAAVGGAVGWGERMRWSLPVTVDVLALVAGLVWLSAGVSDAARSLGRWLTLVTVVGSVVLNAVGHLVSTGHITVGPWLTVAVSAVPPLAAALAVHLAAVTAQGHTAPETDTEPVSPMGDTDTVGTVPVETDTVTDTTVPFQPETDTVADTVDTDPVPDYAHTMAADTADDTDDTTGVPSAGGRLSDAELDMVVVVLVGETDPPRSYNEFEERFRELGYVASAARLRAAWKRTTVPAAS